VQVTGEWGTTGEITIQGSNDGVTWFTLTDSLQTDPLDPTADDLIFSDDGLKDILQHPLYIRPSKSGADAALDVAVVIIGA
jgi:hypothetical protein